MDGDVVVGLVERDHLGAEADARRELGQERARQQVGAAVEVDEVGVVAAELLAQQLEERRVHQRLLVEQEAEHLDRALRPLAQLEELAHAVLVVLGGDRGPRVVALRRGAGAANGSSSAAQSCAGAHALVRRDLEAERARDRRASSRCRTRWPPKKQYASALSIVNGCVASPKRSMSAMRERVRARDAHRAGLGPQPGGERLAQRQDAPADALLRLEDDRVVAGARQLGRRRRGRPCRRRRR